MRPRLQVCNVFIITNKHLKQDECVRINIKTSVVEVTWQSGTREIVQVINLRDYKLRPCSLSALQVLKKSISFRIQTEPVVNVVGSFASEILPIKQSSDIQNSTVKLLAPCICTDRPCQLACKCCGKVLSKQGTLFTRVLPLPSSASWEISDWFCHQHTGSSTMQHSVLAPKETDCLYGMCYILVSASVMNIRNDHVVRCNRCLAWLGKCINSTAFKLWNCTTSYEGNNNSTALEDFIYTVKQAFKKSCTMNCRLVLETKLSEEHSQYLLLWVMDKNLDLLVNANEYISRTEENAGKVIVECKLKVKRTMKLLYMHHKYCDSMVKTWQDDCNVECIEIAKPMFTEGLAYLLRGTEFMPAPYKLTNSFFVTYLGL